jgi:uncharacterized protein (DUF952 family)
LIYHITTRKAWQTAVSEGDYRPPSLTSEGFIHCSFAQQIPGTARRYFCGQSGLVLLGIDPDRLIAELHIEPGADTIDSFPHLYGPLNLDAVRQVMNFDPDSPETPIHT